MTGKCEDKKRCRGDKTTRPEVYYKIGLHYTYIKNQRVKKKRFKNKKKDIFNFTKIFITSISNPT